MGHREWPAATAGACHIALLLLSLQCWLSSAWRRRQYCTEDRAGTCYVKNSYNFSKSVKFEYPGNVIFDQAVWQCDAVLGTFHSISIEIIAAGLLRLQKGSLLHCPTVNIEAHRVAITSSSEVSANGTSALGSTWSTHKDTMQEGGSHGGIGGIAGAECASEEIGSRSRSSSRQVYGDLLAPWHFGRAGRGLGGGRVRVSSRTFLELNGTISAAGEGPAEGEESVAEASAGAGGSVWVTCSELRQLEASVLIRDADEDIGNGSQSVTWASSTSRRKAGLDFDLEVSSFFADDVMRGQGGRIIATGGCCDSCICGGGGRVLTEIIREIEPKQVTVAGGCWRQGVNAACQCGSAGTWVIRRLPSLSKSLWPTKFRDPFGQWREIHDRGRHEKKADRENGDIIVSVDNSHAVSLAATRIKHATPLSEFPVPVELRLQDAVVEPMEDQPTWQLSGLALLSVQVGSELQHRGPETFTLNFTGANRGVELAFSSKLQVDELIITGADHVVLQQNAAILSQRAALWIQKVIDTTRGELGDGSGAFELYAPWIQLGSGRVRSLWAAANEAIEVKTGAVLRSSYPRCDQLPTDLADPCKSIHKSAGFAVLPRAEIVKPRRGGPSPSRRLPIRHLPKANLSIIPNVSSDVVLYARKGNITVEEQAVVHAASILVCGANTSVAGLLSSRGLGCAPNRGEGPGQARAGEMRMTTLWKVTGHNPPRVCGGGGGAHSGDGGDGVYNGTRSVCVNTGGEKYDGWWGDMANRPLQYPTWSASGGGGLAAGAGGGIIWVQATVLDLPSPSVSISASGDDAVSWADGSQEGSGGGGGGSIIINATSVVGVGVMDASGGHGGGCSGGGGGGGAIASTAFEAVETWQNFTGELRAEPGLPDPSKECGHTAGRPGTAGDLLQLGDCRPGSAGIFCAPCPAGKYNPESVSDNSTAHFRVCQECDNKPPHAYYTADGWLNASCPYACPAGYPPVEANPSCEDPMSYHVASIGGIKGVVVAILLTALTFGGALSAGQVKRHRRLKELTALRRTGQARRHNDEVVMLLESVQQSHPLADLELEQQGPSGARQAVTRTPPVRGRRVTSRLRGWFRRGRDAQNVREAVARTFKSKHLLDSKDLPHHLARIYLLGCNSPSDPWYLSHQPIEALQDIIDPFRWDMFAAQVNAICASGMRFQKPAEGILLWLYLPLAEHLRWRLRRSRARKVAAFVWSWSEDALPNQSFWRLIRDNSGRYGLKFGTDMKGTLGFIDVLDYERVVEDWAVKPPVPAVLATAGDGTYMAPIHLDCADPFTQTLAAYFGSSTWQQVLLSFNLMSRLLPPNPDEEDIEPLRETLQGVWKKLLPSTDFQCDAVLFQAPPRKLSPSFMNVDFNMLRQESWEVFSNRQLEPLHAGCLSPSGHATPILRQQTGGSTNAAAAVATGVSSADVEGRMCSRVALVLARAHQPSAPSSRKISRAESDTYTSGPSSSPVGRGACTSDIFDDSGKIPAVLRVGACGLSSPLGVERAEEPSISPAQLSPDIRPASKAPVSHMLNQELEQLKLPGSAETWSNSSFSPSRSRSASGAGTPGRFWGTPTARASQRSYSFSVPLRQRLWQRLLIFLLQARSCLLGAWDGLHKELETAQVWFKSLFRKGPVGGVGRQPSLCLRHRKPRGPKAFSTLVLSALLMFHALAFITQSSVLFRIGPVHGLFFAMLLLPPFGDFAALVCGMLFVFGVDCGPQACLHIVASMTNTAISFAGRAALMDTWRSMGWMFLWTEYCVVFASKIASCRVINSLIALHAAEPWTINDGKADVEWVKNYVLHGRVTEALNRPQGAFSRSESLDDSEPPMIRFESFSVTGFLQPEGGSPSSSTHMSRLQNQSSESLRKSFSSFATLQEQQQESSVRFRLDRDGRQQQHQLP